MSELEPLHIIEAALFMSSKPLSVNELAKICEIGAIGFVEKEVKRLKEEYEKMGSAIQIVNEGDGYIMRLKEEYAKKVSNLAQEAELSKGALKILAFISKNEGIEQSKVVKLLGSGVYAYVKELIEEGFISAEKKGRTKVLRTSEKFKEYFK